MNIQCTEIQSSESKKTAPSDFGGNLGSASAIAGAAASGEVVLFPAVNELFIDIDSEEAMHLFTVNITKVDEYVGVLDTEVVPSRSGPVERSHITVRLEREVTDMERILLQAVLGSDLRRELLSYCRITMDDPHPTLFLEKGLQLLGGGQEAAA